MSEASRSPLLCATGMATRWAPKAATPTRSRSSSRRCARKAARRFPGISSSAATGCGDRSPAATKHANRHTAVGRSGSPSRPDSQPPRAAFEESAMSAPHRSSLLWLGLAVGGLALPAAANGEPLQRVPMTAEELRNVGIDLRIIDPRHSTSGGFYEKRGGFPNKCYYSPSSELSISDAMLRHFEARGFSLQSLCLAMQSTLRYDPETGKQLPLAAAVQPESPGQPPEAIGRYEVLLNVPDCFKNGTPLIDCVHSYDASFGSADNESEQSRALALQEDAKIRAFIARGGYARECTCNDIRFSGND